MNFQEKPADGPNNTPLSPSAPCLSPADDDKLRKPRRRLRRWLLALFAVVLFLLAVAGTFVFAGHEIVVKRLADATAEQDAMHPGWRLEDIEAARARVADDDNGALLVMTAAKLLPRGWDTPDLDYPKQNAEAPPNIRLHADHLKRLRAALEPLTQARTSARRLADRSNGRYRIVYQMVFPSSEGAAINDMHAVSHLLVLDALLRTEDGDLAGAAVSCRAALNVGRSVGDEPLVISQLVRNGCVRTAEIAVERLLAHGELDDANLATLQRAFEEEAAYPSLLYALQGERACLHNFLHAMADGDISLDVNQKGPATWSERCCTFRERDDIRRRHARVFPLLNKLVEVGQVPPDQRAQAWQRFQTMHASQPNGLIDALLLGVDAMPEKFTRYDAYLNCLIVALAVERYRHLHGDWPPTLPALLPKFLDDAPFDIYDAQPLRYERLQDGGVIYSLCPDSKGNVFNPDEPSPPGEGIAVRLWDVTQRKKSE